MISWWLARTCERVYGNTLFSPTAVDRKRGDSASLVVRLGHCPPGNAPLAPTLPRITRTLDRLRSRGCRRLLGRSHSGGSKHPSPYRPCRGQLAQRPRLAPHGPPPVPGYGG